MEHQLYKTISELQSIYRDRGDYLSNEIKRLFNSREYQDYLKTYEQSESFFDVNEKALQKLNESYYENTGQLVGWLMVTSKNSKRIRELDIVNNKDEIVEIINFCQDELVNHLKELKNYYSNLENSLKNQIASLYEVERQYFLSVYAMDYLISNYDNNSVIRNNGSMHFYFVNCGISKYNSLMKRFSRKVYFTEKEIKDFIYEVGEGANNPENEKEIITKLKNDKRWNYQKIYEYMLNEEIDLKEIKRLGKQDKKGQKLIGDILSFYNARTPETDKRGSIEKQIFDEFPFYVKDNIRNCKKIYSEYSTPNELDIDNIKIKISDQTNNYKFPHKKIDEFIKYCFWLHSKQSK